MATVATTGGSSHGGREARRRRIMERGSDRLALITGRIQSLPPDLDQSRSSEFSLVETAADSAQHEDAKAPNSSLPYQESTEEPEQQRIFDAEPLPHTSDKGGSITSRSVALHDTKEEPPQISSSMQRSPQNHQRDQRHRNSITPGQISSAIAASENLRNCCSIVAAVLVILSSIGFPVLGLHNIRGIVMFRPVYLLLLTNISIVLGRVMLGTQGISSRTGRMSSISSSDGNSLANQLGTALGLGLLLQNIVQAMFMDFSIYAVVVVSGLSLVGRLGW